MTIRRFVPVLLLLAAVGICLALLFGFLGRLHMAFDSFAHLRIHFAALLALVGMALLSWRGWRLAGAGASASPSPLWGGVGGGGPRPRNLHP
jgi:endonuclease/exonuclease/phosphatase (EEP) superfamily protein YafD